MSYGELPTNELARLAHKGAEHFSISPEMLKERDIVQGYAIEEIACVDSVVSAATDAAGQDVLRVSAAAVNLAVESIPPLAAYALRKGYAIFNEEGIVSPMVPRLLSEEKLSLLDGCVRPVLSLHLPVSETGAVGELTLTRDLVQSQVLSPAEAEAAWVKENGEGPLSRLERIARNLCNARHRDLELHNDFYLEEEDGTEAPADYPVGLFIIQEATFAVGAAAGAYMKRHDIPAVFSNHVLDFDDQFWARDDPDLARHLARLRYSILPQGHLALGLTAQQPFAHVMMPLKSYDDLLNVSNLVAQLEGRDYPFDTDAAKYAARRLNFLAEKTPTPAPKESPGQTRKALLSAADLAQKLEDGTIHARDLSHALFGKITEDAWTTAELQQQAASFLETNAHLSRQVWQIAIARNWIRLVSQPSGQGGKLETFALNDAGEEFPYQFTGMPRVDNFKAAAVIGRLIGHEIQPTGPTKEEKIKRDPYRYLENLSVRHGLRLARDILERNEATGEVTLQFRLQLHGTWHRYTLTGPSIRATEKEAGFRFINDLGLAEGIPSAPIRTEAAESPITRLNNHCARRGVGSPTFTIPEAEKTTKSVSCRLDYVDAEGNPQTIIVTAADERSAKTKAAELALSQLPPPLPRKNKKKKRT